MVKRLGFVLLVCALVGAGATARADEFARCETKTIQSAFDRAPTQLVAKLTGDKAVKIVAFGSSSTFGTGASSPAATYPARLEAELSRAFPSTPVAIVNAGVVGDTAAMMLARMERDVIALRPDVVIWQVGTNDIDKAVPRDLLRAQIREGLARLRAAGSDVVLMETQWYPRLGETSDWPGYRADLRLIAAETGTPLIQRYEMMKGWINSGLFKESDLLAADRFHMKDMSYGCLARSLAVELKADAQQFVSSAKALTVGALQITP
jgi:acyl-CoA thioesterase-1